MIDQKSTRVFDTKFAPVETGFVFEDEGMAAVYVREGDKTVVKASTGVGGEVFAGITQSRNIPPKFAPAVIEGVVPAGGVIELPRLPVVGQILVKIDGVVVEVEASAPSDATTVQLSGTDITTFASAVGKAYVIQFHYEPTVAEARTFVGDAPVGGLSSSAQGVIGLFKRGEIATSYFDASVDWSSAIKVKLGADGYFTTTGSGTELTNAVVAKAPSAGSPVLVLDLSL
jgi:hypothetical protein